MNTKYYYATSASIASKQKIIRYLKQSKQELMKAGTLVEGEGKKRRTRLK